MLSQTRALLIQCLGRVITHLSAHSLSPTWLLQGLGAQSFVAVNLTSYNAAVAASTLVNVSDSPVCIIGLSTLALTGFSFTEAVGSGSKTIGSGSESAALPSLLQTFKLKMVPQQVGRSITGCSHRD